MKEAILQYVWQYKLFSTLDQKTTDGETVEVIDAGKLNSDAGPDFFNAKIKIGSTVWAGNVEIHEKSGDWKKHNHDTDKSYDSVILHVVLTADEPVYRVDGQLIPQLEIKFPEKIIANYDELVSQQNWIPCADKIGTVPAIFIESWKNALLTERLESKMMAIEQLLNQNNQHWEEAFYITLARSFGFGTNSQAFEMLAKSLPLTAIGKHKNDVFQIEALLFGQAGLLSEELDDDYYQRLKKEFEFLKSKFSLRPLSPAVWKLLRLRPDNFPHVRIAQFAALIHRSTKLFSRIVENPEMDYLSELFICEPTEYWKKHYLFAHESAARAKKLGKQSVYSIVINTVVPFLFCYAHLKGNQELKDRALKLLEQIPAERNSVTGNWQNLGIHVGNAFDSQAMLQLKKNYCDDKKCLRCRIGHKVLTN